MSKTFKSIYSCLDRRLKTYLFIMILLNIIVPILELVGVAAIIPIIQISLNDFNFPEHHFLDVFFKIFTDEMNESLIIYLMIFFIFIFFIFKAFFLIFSEKFKLKYIKSL